MTDTPATPTRQQMAALAADRNLPPAMRAQVWKLLDFHDKFMGAQNVVPAHIEPVDLSNTPDARVAEPPVA